MLPVAEEEEEQKFHGSPEHLSPFQAVDNLMASPKFEVRKQSLSGSSCESPKQTSLEF